MNFTQSFRLALKSLSTSKMRSLLTMLGIIIGVAAVIIITSLGNGMQVYMNEEFEALGSNQVDAMILGDNDSSRHVDIEDMFALVERYPQYLSGVTPELRAPLTVRHGGDEFSRTTVKGVSETYYSVERGTSMNGEKLAKGRFLSYVDAQRQQSVCVVGAYLEREAFGGNAMGKTLTLSGVPFTVVGVLDVCADVTEGSGDDVVYLPYTQAVRLSGTTSSEYLFAATSRETAPAAKGLVERELFKIFQDSDRYVVLTAAEMMDAMNTMLDLLMTILTLIAALSLLVGGIGIMNIMLVSVTERTREIGIRKSLGAKPKNIRWQFVIEAGTTSAIGGVLGIGLGILAANLLTMILSMVLGSENSFHAVPTLSGILVAFGVSVAIGVLFGYLPANKAAKLNPIDALRYE